MRARLKADVYCGVAEQRFVLGAYRCECVHLGMWPAIAAVVALAYDASVGRYDDSSYHRIGLCAHYAAAGKLQTAVHVLFVGHCFFFFEKRGCCGVMLLWCDLLIWGCCVEVVFCWLYF